MRNWIAMGIILAASPALAAAPAVRSVFDFECAQADALAAGSVKKLAATAASAKGAEGQKVYGDRAVAIDPDADGRQELAVPLWCSPTGNCTWEIYGGTPARSLGRIEAQVLRIPEAEEDSEDARILTYAHVSTEDGALSSYVYRDGTFVKELEAEIAASDAIQRLGCDRGKAACCK